jgi:hypothetical protein
MTVVADLHPLIKEQDLDPHPHTRDPNPKQSEWWIWIPNL